MDSKRIPQNGDTKSQRRRDLQKRNRRARTLILKAVDMSVLCDAEIFLGIRIRETGRVTTFCSHPSGIWSSANPKSYFPAPVEYTLNDFQNHSDTNTEASSDENSPDEEKGDDDEA